MTSKVNEEISADTIASEKRLFWLLTIVLAPLLSVAIVGGLGFAIWIFQMIFGPPGPPTNLS